MKQILIALVFLCAMGGCTGKPENKVMEASDKTEKENVLKNNDANSSTGEQKQEANARIKFSESSMQSGSSERCGTQRYKETGE